MSLASRNFIIILAGILIIAGVFLYGSATVNAPDGAGDLLSPQTREYINEEQGFSFSYRIQPGGYTLLEEEQADNSDDMFLHGVILMNTGDYENLVASAIVSDGPPSIFVTVYKNPDNLSPLAWAEENSNRSLYSLILSPTSETYLGGTSAISFTADGLYPSEVIVGSNDSKIYVISGQYNSPEDQIRSDFKELLSSFKLF